MLRQIQYDSHGVDDFELETEEKPKGRKKYVIAALAAFAFAGLLIFFSQQAAEQINTVRENIEPIKPVELEEQETGKEDIKKCGNGLCDAEETCGTCLPDCSCGALACNVQAGRCESVRIDSLAEAAFPGRDYKLLYFSEYNGRRYYVVDTGGEASTIFEDGAVLQPT